MCEAFLAAPDVRHVDLCGEASPGDAAAMIRCRFILTERFDAVEQPRDVAFEVSYTSTEVVATVTAVTVSTRPDVDIPEAFALHSAYPNPAVDRVSISFDLAEAARVRLAMYDALGRRVAMLADGMRSAGRHKAIVDRDKLASGLYIVRMRVKGFVQSRRVAFLY